MKRVIVVFLAVSVLAQQQPLAGFAGEFVHLLVRGDFAAAEQSFDPTMKSKLPADKLRIA
jgi:hypothetical protein